MLNMHSKHDNMHKNGIFYALIFINKHIISCVNSMLSANTSNNPLSQYLLEHCRHSLELSMKEFNNGEENIHKSIFTFIENIISW